jgi:hypothetical protein
MNASDEHVIRQLRCRYDGLLAKDEALVNAGIYWYVPKNSTMLTVDKEDLLENYGFVTDADAVIKPNYSKEGYDCYYKQILAQRQEIDGKPTWVFNKDGIAGALDNRDFFYKIKPYYDQGAR